MANLKLKPDIYQELRTGEPHLPWKFEQTQPRKPQALQERTNQVAHNIHERNSGAPILIHTRTPGTSPKLDVPFTADICSSPAPTSIAEHNDKDLRRLKRYSTAQEGLTAAFRQCATESSALELQIRTLEQVTRALTAHANDARERVETLQAVLADRAMDPTDFERLKREKWMEERRQSSANEERRLILQYLDALVNPQTEAQTSPPIHLVTKAQYELNLAKFFESLQNHKSIHPRVSRSERIEYPPKRRTIHRSSPMRLRTSTTADFYQLTKHRLRALSLDGQKHSPHHVPTISQSNPPSEDIPRYKPPPAHTTLATPICLNNMPSSADDDYGTAAVYTILPYTSDHTSQDIQIPLPDYAIDLLTQFDEETAAPLSLTMLDLPSSYVEPQSKIPHSSPTESPKRESPVVLDDPPIATPRPRKPYSHRQLDTLFSIPEALSSRLSYSSISNHEIRAENDMAACRASVSSIEVAAGARRSQLTEKIKRRFSGLLRHGNEQKS